MWFLFKVHTYTICICICFWTISISWNGTQCMFLLHLIFFFYQCFIVQVCSPYSFFFFQNLLQILPWINQQQNFLWSKNSHCYTWIKWKQAIFYYIIIYFFFIIIKVLSLLVHLWKFKYSFYLVIYFLSIFLTLSTLHSFYFSPPSTWGVKYSLCLLGIDELVVEKIF